MIIIKNQYLPLLHTDWELVIGRELKDFIKVYND